MSIWPVLIMMTLTSYRVTRLITKDDFPPLLWVRDRLVGGWRPLTTREIERRAAWLDTHANAIDTPMPADLAYGVNKMINGVEHRYLHRRPWVPYWLAELLGCPWCVSAYLAGALTFAVDWTVGLPVPWLVGPSVWAGAALLGSREWA